MWPRNTQVYALGVHNAQPLSREWKSWSFLLFFSIITIVSSVTCCMKVCIFLVVVVINGVQDIQKQKNKKSSATFKQAAGTLKQVGLLNINGEAVALTISVPEALKAKQANNKTSET